MTRILAVSSQVAYGPVGLTAAVPALQARGHEVLAVPTITLSNHPGLGVPAGFRTEPGRIGAILDALERLKLFKEPGAVLTGYFASPEQVREVADFLRRQRNTSPLVMVDPVIGDGSALYVPPEVAAAVSGELLPLAHITTPNRFELEWLTGQEVADEASAVAAARRLAAPEMLATSIPCGDDCLATLLITPAAICRHVARKRPDVPHGTGDLLSGLYLSHRVSIPAEAAFHKAMAQLEHAIALSAGNPVLNVAGALAGT